MLGWPLHGTAPITLSVVQFATRPDALVTGGKVCVNRSAAKTALVLTTMTAIAPRIITLVFKIPQGAFEGREYLA